MPHELIEAEARLALAQLDLTWVERAGSQVTTTEAKFAWDSYLSARRGVSDVRFGPHPY